MSPWATIMHLNSQDKIMFLDSSQSCNMWGKHLFASQISLWSLRRYFNVNLKADATCKHPSLATNRSTSTTHLFHNKSGPGSIKKTAIDTQIYIFNFRFFFPRVLHFLGFGSWIQMAWSFDVSSTQHTHPNDQYFQLVNQAAVQGHKIPVSSVQKPDRRDYRLASNESTHTQQNKTAQTCS